MSACYFSLKLRNSEKNIMKSLVDFGCGDGWYLSANRSRGFSLAGFEPHSKFTENLSCRLGIPIFSELKSLFEMHEDKTDVVTMHFVLEHLTNLNEAFETVNRLLKKGGIFYFVIPNIASWETKLFGKKWHNLDPPRHISFPEPKAISELARKWGFTIISEKNKSFPNGIAGSLSVVLAGNFSYPLFIMFMPVGVILSKIFPSGNKGYILQKL